MSASRVGSFGFAKNIKTERSRLFCRRRSQSPLCQILMEVDDEVAASSSTAEGGGTRLMPGSSSRSGSGTHRHGQALLLPGYDAVRCFRAQVA